MLDTSDPPIKIEIRMTLRQMVRLLSSVVCLAAAITFVLPAEGQGPTYHPPVDAHNIVAPNVDRPLDLTGSWLVHQGDDPAYASTTFDDSQWTVIDISKPLASYGIVHPNFVWYRRGAESARTSRARPHPGQACSHSRIKVLAPAEEGPEMIVLMGYIYLEPSDVREFLVDLENIAIGTRAERGCLFYAVAMEDASSGRMLLAQRWLDEDTFTAHLAGPHVASFQRRWANKTKIDVQRYEVVDDLTGR